MKQNIGFFTSIDDRDNYLYIMKRPIGDNPPNYEVEIIDGVMYIYCFVKCQKVLSNIIRGNYQIVIRL